MMTTLITKSGERTPYARAHMLAHVHRMCAVADPALVKVNAHFAITEIEKGMVNTMNVTELAELAQRACAALATTHPDYLALAGRMRVSALHRATTARFSTAFATLPRATDEAKKWVSEHAEELDGALRPERDFLINFFGMATLEKSYLIRDASSTRILERPCHMWMRCAIGVASEAGLAEVLEAYELMSTLIYTHATPTLFNAATTMPQLSSCFLLGMKDDSIAGIFETLSDTAKISKSAGGVGLSISNVRAKGSAIRGTGGVSNGLVPMLRCFNEAARYVDQGGGKRKGSFACYLEPWHADVFSFLDLRKNTGTEHERCRDLFLALWIPDLFMKRVQADESWSLFCPHEAPGLDDVHSAEFDELYEKYEREGRARRSIPARELFSAILVSQIETGTPYLLYKDAANSKSNQKHLGTIKCSNLCTEIIEYTSPDETAVCNLASIALPKFVRDKAFDYDELHRVTRIVVKNLDRVIDRNQYPVDEARTSNLKHRPVGLGVQGLADVFQLLELKFDSAEAVALSESIFETLYHAALTESCSLARAFGRYASFEGSPASRGELQFDMWDKTDYVHEKYGEARWQTLRDDIVRHGLRNSLLVAPMPTASTSQILGNTESIEPVNTNLYARQTLAGSFTVVNARLVRALEEHELWDDATRTKLIEQRGNADNLGLPADVAARFKSVWQISQKWLIDHAAARAPFVCQSQSLNLYAAEPTAGKLASMHMYAWSTGLKTGAYYVRTRSVAETTQFSLSAAPAPPPAASREVTDGEPAAAAAAAGPALACSRRDEEEGCLSCGS